MTTVPEIDLADPEVVRDPFTTYGRVREIAPLARIAIPGMAPLWALTRHEDAKTMLTDPRFVINSDSFIRPPGIPEHCLEYMRTMSELDGPEHARLRKLVSPAFTARRAADFRPRIESIVESLLDDLPNHVENGSVDLLRHFAWLVPVDVICELVGIPTEDRPAWRTHAANIAAGYGPGFADAVPAIMAGAKAAVASRRANPDGDLLSDLVRIQDEEGDRLSETELVTLVWHLVLAGQTPANLIPNAVQVLHSHPEQLAALRADASLLPRAVDEVIRFSGPALLSIPRYATEDVELHGTLIHKGDAISAVVASTNHDPRTHTTPTAFDITRPTAATHLGFGHGPHFCLGASLAKAQTEVALSALWHRFPALALATPAEDRAPDPGTWRLTSLRATL
ncbi:cytochrome P450 [Umezawaea sp. Da 62-37]|uniref:cytochrome P450 family protein n=1 Tax=Umezawaea sp. Da 62-37 TaxID=3075927 RepID=UPI0028F7151B|nr:cytochrome P450 [Umezawaea sp. Da 62-37]WNV84299.1 cytochrome P450 [Umezawaea sp. Da 62-37]